VSGDGLPKDSHMLKVTVHEVDASRWPDFERLFESRGGPKACWCMMWRARGAEAKNTKGSARKVAIKARVDDGVPIGLLAYVDGDPIAWCSIAPRSTYRPLGGEDEPSERVGEVWSLVCFFIRREFRGQGVTEQLIEAAVDYARRNGATALEAYPVDPGSPSYRFMGYVPSFEAAGFEEIGRASPGGAACRVGLLALAAHAQRDSLTRRLLRATLLASIHSH
jgi:GNAT superfamily N-acetyltransferase